MRQRLPRSPSQKHGFSWPTWVFGGLIAVSVLWVGASFFGFGIRVTSGPQIVHAHSGPWKQSFPMGRTDPSKGEYWIVAISDLDKESLDPKYKSGETNRQAKWYAVLKTAKITGSGSQWSVDWQEDIVIESKFGEAGRGMELSDLAWWNDRLYACDDRSGIVYEITKSYQAIPRWILMEGDGNETKGLKCEWLSVRNGQLFVGSFGKDLFRLQMEEM
eukprot:GABV01001543.1.p1 GENE.GABV01001543.1~~GABV01001543.1.p1  ORF type:complete len:217 (+),score=49.73 GABV01001543.1:10-660(+)